MQPTWIWQFSIFQAAKTITLSLMFFLLSPPPSLSRTPLSMSLVILLLLLSGLGMALSVWPCNQEDTKISLTIFRLDETFLFILHPSISLSLSKNTSFYDEPCHFQGTYDPSFSLALQCKDNRLGYQIATKHKVEQKNTKHAYSSI